MCEKYLKFGRLLEIVPEDYMVSLMCDEKEIMHCVTWVLKQEPSYYKLYDTSVLAFRTDCYNEVCTITIELKPSVRIKSVNEKLNLSFIRRI